MSQHFRKSINEQWDSINALVASPDVFKDDLLKLDLLHRTRSDMNKKRTGMDDYKVVHTSSEEDCIGSDNDNKLATFGAHRGTVKIHDTNDANQLNSVRRTKTDITDLKK